MGLFFNNNKNWDNVGYFICLHVRTHPACLYSVPVGMNPLNIFFTVHQKICQCYVLFSPLNLIGLRDSHERPISTMRSGKTYLFEESISQLFLEKKYLSFRKFLVFEKELWFSIQTCVPSKAAFGLLSKVGTWCDKS